MIAKLKWWLWDCGKKEWAGPHIASAYDWFLAGVIFGALVFGGLAVGITVAINAD